jgi:hypothetical protein
MNRITKLAAGVVAMTIISATPAFAVNEIKIYARHLYGPGPFPDQELGAGHVRSMNFTDFMTATVPAFNNGPAEPNVSGEARQGTSEDGRLSDGTLINENIDMGNAVIMNGQFNLLLGAVYGGPHQGNSSFSLDEDYNWTINDDIAIDAGIPEAVVKINNFTFSTGPRIVTASIQTEKKYPGGTDKTGSVVAGDVLVGRVGDDDMDGYVDGLFFAMGRFPLSSVILPGATFVQSVEFRSDIKIKPADAALLSIANARNCLHKYIELTAANEKRPSIDNLAGIADVRLKTAVKHLERAAIKTECGEDCQRIDELHKNAVNLNKDMSKDRTARLAKLEKIFIGLREIHSASAFKSSSR